MNILLRAHFKAAFVLFLLAVAAVGISACAAASAADSKEFEAEVTTGVNRLYGKPLLTFDFMPDPLKETFGFDTMAIYNSDGPTPITAATPDSAVLASYVDPKEGTADPALVNLPLRDVATWVLPPDLQHRSALPGHLAGGVVDATQAEPAQPITKGDWFKASGKMNVKCDSKGNSVTIRAKDLIPHRLYTVWAIWLNPAGSGSFIPRPFGGAPNSFVTDQKGDATFERALNFCPMDAALNGVDGVRLGIIDAHLHSDHSAYGAIPAPFAAGLPPGTTIHEHLSWNPGAGRHN